MNIRLLSCVALSLTLFLGTFGLANAASDSGNVPSSFLYQAIGKYYDGNYTGCIQDMDYLLRMGKASDVAYYFSAMSFSKIGFTEKARELYEAALSSSSNPTLIDYATAAVECIDDAKKCNSQLSEGDITRFINSGEYMHDDVKKVVREKETDRLKQEINSNSKPVVNTQYLNYNNTEPTDKEIADAVRTLAKIGINPFGGNQNMYANTEYSQLSALLGGQNANMGSNMASLLPYVAQSSKSSNLNKDFVQTYMMTQMLPNFNFNSSDK